MPTSSLSQTRPPAPGETEPELRRVSLLFADIAGSTALVQNLDAEDAAGLIDPALQAMIEAAERFDGVVSGRGDGIMAIFGAASGFEDHGVRACLAALAMRETLARQSAGGEGPVRVRVGIHAGEVVFRPIRIGGMWSQDAVGIAVHIAARLEQTAEPGEICISEAVWPMVRGFVTAEPLAPVQVRGVDAPVARLALRGAAVAGNRWAVRAARGLARFVDRDAERGQLGAALGRRGLALVQIIGGAGLGKSRLLHEFMQLPAVQACQVIYLAGDMHRSFIAFHPVASWLRVALGIGAEDPAAVIRDKLVAGLAGLGDRHGIDAELLARILELGPRPLAGEAARPSGTIEFGPTMAALITTMAGGRHTVLVCDDIDHFDAASRDVLAQTLPLLAGADVLVVTASRARVRLAELARVPARRITLAPLPDADAGALLDALDAAVAGNETMRALILRKAAGNPLFLEEVAPLVARSAGGTAGLDLPDADIPDRVDALIADRLARLPRALRRVVQLCAVIGAEVPLGLAAAVTGIAPKALHATLLKLQGEQLLYEMRRHPEPLFAFKHALTRDVAYRTLLAAQRRAHHARIVAFLEGDGGVQDAQRLADLCVHTIQAQLWPKAVTYLRKAAGPAAERGAYRLAVGYLERAIEIVRRLPDDDAAARTQMELLLEHGVVQTHVGGYRQSSASLAAAQALAARLDDGPASLRIHSLQVHVFNILGQLDEAVALGQRTRALARQAGNTALALYATFFLGQSFHNAGRLREAEAMLTENLAMIAAGAEPNLAVFHGTITVLTHGTRAMSRAFLGDFAGAHADYEAARTQAVSSGRPYDKVFALGTRSFSLLHQRSAQSEASFRDAIEAAETLSVAQLLIPLQTGLGQALLMGPDLATASATLSAAHRAAREGSRTMYQINAAIGLVVAGLRMGEPDLARSFAAEACDLAARAGFQGCQVAALRARGLALAAMAGGEDEALALLAQACALGEALGMRADVAHAHAALAALRQAGHLEEAERRYAALGMEEWFTVIRADIAADRVPYL